MRLFMNEIVYDNGNRSSQIAIKDKVIQLPSQYKTSNLLSQSFPNQASFEYKGSFYRVGDVHDLESTNITKTLEEGKVNTCLPHFIGLMSHVPHIVNIDRLHVVTTNPDRDLSSYKKKLLGEHNYFKLDCGVRYEYKFVVKEVVAIEEGLGAFYDYSDNNTINKPFVLVINIGAGTLDFIVYDRTGEILLKINKANTGAIHLVNLFNQYSKQKKKIEFDIDCYDFFSKLESGELEGINVFTTILKKWISKRIQELTPQLSRFSGKVDKTVITGGLAPLIDGDKFYVSPQARVINSLGISKRIENSTHFRYCS